MVPEAILTLVTAGLAPVVALATVVLLPFGDRITQGAVLYAWTSYIALVAVVL